MVLLAVLPTSDTCDIHGELPISADNPSRFCAADLCGSIPIPAGHSTLSSKTERRCVDCRESKILLKDFTFHNAAADVTAVECQGRPVVSTFTGAVCFGFYRRSVDLCRPGEATKSLAAAATTASATSIDLEEQWRRRGGEATQRYLKPGRLTGVVSPAMKCQLAVAACALLFACSAEAISGCQVNTGPDVTRMVNAFTRLLQIDVSEWHFTPSAASGFVALTPEWRIPCASRLGLFINASVIPAVHWGSECLYDRPLMNRRRVAAPGVNTRHLRHGRCWTVHRPVLVKEVRCNRTHVVSRSVTINVPAGCRTMTLF